MARLRPGHYGDAKPVGDGVDELRIFEGKGYRVDFKRQDDWKRIMEFKTTPYEASDYLDSPEAVEAYLEAAFETNDVALISVAMGAVAKAKGMGGIATKSGLSRVKSVSRLERERESGV